MSKADAIDEVGEVMRGFMAYAVLFQDAVARRAGLNATDLQCLNLLSLQGPMTPGALAEASGISGGGAITALIDRLERAGLAARARDVVDRRKVLVTADADQIWQRLGPLYQGVQRRWADHLHGLSIEQIRFAADLLRTATAINQAETENLRGSWSERRATDADRAPTGE